MPDQVQSFFEDYTRVFNAADAVAITKFYHVPSISMRGDGSVVCYQSAEEIERFFKRVADGYLGEADFGRFHSLTTQPIGTQSVLATLTWQLVRKDGSPVREWRQSYNLVHVNGRWQIFVSTFHRD
jgi:hypothetical protein